MKLEIATILEKRVSKDNIFLVEYYSVSGRFSHTEPNWALIISLIVIAALLTITLIAIFCYRSWLRKTLPVHFAGKSTRMHIGDTVNSDCIFWIQDQVQSLEKEYGKIIGLYTDSELKHPLNQYDPIHEPLFIYPKFADATPNKNP